MARYNIGLDFGTTNSILAYLQDGKLEAFQYGGEQGQKYVPSFIAYEDDVIEVGLAARNTAANNPEAECYGNFKMDLPLNENFTNHYQDNRTPISVTIDYLRELLLSCDNQYSFTQQQGEIAGIVVSVPEIWQRDIRNQGREHLQKLITQELGLEKQLIQLVSEPVAAAAYYTWETRRRAQENDEEPFTGNLLVCDMGGGTFDVSICKVSGDNKVEVLYFDGQGEKGLESAGVAFDRQCVRIAYQKKHGSPPDENNPDFFSLLQSFERIKIGNHTKFTHKLENYLKDPDSFGKKDLYIFNGYTLTCDEVKQSFKIIEEKIHQVMEKVKNWLVSNKQHFDRLFLVGGFCQFLLVQKSIYNALGINEYDSRIEQSFNIINSAYAIAYGSCLIANKLVDPVEKYIHSLGIVVDKVDSEGKREKYSITIIEGGIGLDKLAATQFANVPPLVVMGDNQPLSITLWINPQCKGRIFEHTIPEMVKITNCSAGDKWRVGMRVNRSQITYLVLKAVNKNQTVEYELGNIIALMFPTLMFFEENEEEK